MCWLYSAAVNIGLRVSFGIMVFSRFMPRSGLLDHMAVLFLVFKGTSILFSMVGVPIYISINSVRRLPFLHILSRIYCL